ncbi:ribonuclease HII [Patescibacteria group bacterium]|nr:ribonuclease HII [Patescibacteria group bacterium]MCL5797677.1 ribonuclease HII [Patescibacteria group bacterium]
MQLPDFSFENKCWQKGYDLVIGVDEVGRGAFAGPVVAGAVVLKRFNQWKVTSDNRSAGPVVAGTAVVKEKSYVLGVEYMGIDDSKRLSPQKREKLDIEIRKYFYFGIGQAGVAEINRFGIVAATEKAMRCAIKRVLDQGLRIKENENPKNPDSCFIIRDSNVFLLLDGFNIKYIPGIGLKNQKAIIKGDRKSISIAAASIVAKVARDNMMCELSGKYEKYKWDENKGYGTSYHRLALSEYGATRFHRRQFVSAYI